jgi:hypothetical protein
MKHQINLGFFKAGRVVFSLIDHLQQHRSAVNCSRWRLLSLAIVLATVVLGSVAASAHSSLGATMKTEADWITLQAQANCPNPVAGNWVDGAIGQYAFPASGTQIVDAYRGNFAALGLLAAGPKYYPNVQRWANWYINNINWPDNLNQYATVYWYDVDPHACTEVASTTTKGISIPGYDAEDSWAATYLTLIAAWAKVDPTDADPFIQKWSNQLGFIAEAAYAMHQSQSGLTGAKVGWTTQYLMDNSEVVEGLNSYVWIAATVLQDQDTVNNWTPLVQGINASIQSNLWQQCGSGFYCDAYGDPAHSWVSCKVPSTLDNNYEYFWDGGLTGEAQVWPAFSGLAQNNWSTVLGALNTYCPTWKSAAGLPSSDQTYPLLPDSGIGLAAALVGDTSDATVWIKSTESQWVANPLWPWTVFDAGNTIRAANLLNGGTDPVP